MVKVRTLSLDKAISADWFAGHSLADIAARNGVSIPTAWRSLRETSIPGAQRLSKAKTAAIVRALRAGRKARALADKYGCTTSNIYAIRKKHSAQEPSLPRAAKRKAASV